MSAFFDLGKDILSKQPFSLLLGRQLTRLEPGVAKLGLCATEQMKRQHGLVHGGAVSYLADNCLTFAGGSVIGDSVTSEYKIDYIHPAIGDRLVAKGSVLLSGKHQAGYGCHVFDSRDSEEKQAAVAQGTLSQSRGGREGFGSRRPGSKSNRVVPHWLRIPWSATAVEERMPTSGSTYGVQLGDEGNGRRRTQGG